KETLAVRNEVRGWSLEDRSASGCTIGMVRLPWLLILPWILWPAWANAEEMASAESSPHFKIEAPDVALRNVPLPGSQPVRITALTPDGEVDETFQGPVQIDGIKITQSGKEFPVARLE